MINTLYTIDSREVSAKEFDEFEKGLSGKEGWYCKECSRGGITGWIARDNLGRKFEVKYDQSEKPFRSSITPI